MSESRLSAKRLLWFVAVVVFGLAGVFGFTVVQNRQAYREYRRRSLPDPLPWEQRDMTVEDCVVFTVDWAMACPGIESWCFNDAPPLTRACMASRDRSAYCGQAGDAVASTKFGYGECEAMRDLVEGRYTKRSHKKFCAASYRAVAEFCREAKT